MNQQVVQMLAKLADPARHAQILVATVSEVWRHYPWLLVLGAGVLICGYDRRLVLRTPLIILSSVVLGYFAIYLITPLDLGYHLGSSLDRLLLQLWPIGLFVFFSSVRMPEGWTAEAPLIVPSRPSPPLNRGREAALESSLEG
jgi:hypothetical protein